MSTPVGTDEIRRSWRADWLRSIEEFSNIEIQRATWLNLRNTNPHYSFVEYVCKYFDDLGLSSPGRGYDTLVAEGVLSRAEADTVSVFHALLDAYEAPNGDNDRAAILEDTRWHEVVASAQLARDRLAMILKDSAEAQILAEPSQYALLASQL